MLLLMAATPLAGALLSQYGFNLHPCHLCILQRIPYSIVMGLAVLYLLLGRKCPHALKLLTLLSAALFLADGGIAAFHAGVEWHWWQEKSWWPWAANLLGLESCSGTGAADSIEQLRAMLMHAPTARCDQPQFVFLKLSMAGYNALYALGATLVTLKITCNLAREERHHAK